MVPKMGDNESAAWSSARASRKRLITGLLHIKTALKSPKSGSKSEIVNIG
jgi:hypothetical protein